MGNTCVGCQVDNVWSHPTVCHTSLVQLFISEPCINIQYNTMQLQDKILERAEEITDGHFGWLPNTLVWLKCMRCPLGLQRVVTNINYHCFENLFKILLLLSSV